MDLSNLNTKTASEEGRECHLRDFETGALLYMLDADGKQDLKKPLTITVVGADSDKHRQIQNTIVRSNGKKAATPETVDESVTRQLAGCTVGWRNIVVNGSPLKHSVDTAKDLYHEYRWIREQVASFINDRTNFLPKA